MNANGNLLWMALVVADGLTPEEVLHGAQQLGIEPRTTKVNTLGQDLSARLEAACKRLLELLKDRAR